ncbi:MAG: hypothetical protein IT211_08930 [Armatimonadetes bacterium]|nr:hypothetical protein [Armatimonadota bacterium]
MPTLAAMPNGNFFLENLARFFMGRARYRMSGHGGAWPLFFCIFFSLLPPLYKLPFGSGSLSLWQWTKFDGVQHGFA